MLKNVLSRISKENKQTHTGFFKSLSPPRFVWVITLFFVILRIPSLFELFWYGDEGIYGGIARGMLDGKVLYSQVWDHKPPLIYALYYLTAFWGPAVNIFLMKLLSIFAGIVSIYFLQKVLQILSVKKIFQILSLCAFAFLIGAPVLEGNSANAEVLYIPLNIIIFYLLLTKRRYWLVGILAFLSFALKTTGFIESAFLIFLFVLLSFLGDKKEFKKILIGSTVGFLVPLATMLGWLMAVGAFKDFVNAAFVYSFAYSSQMAHAITFLWFACNPSLFKAVAFLSIFLATLFLYGKKYISKKAFLVLNLFAVEVYMCLLSGRNYAHYLLQVTPSVAMILGIGLQKFAKEKVALKRLLYVIIFVASMQFVVHAFTGGAALDSYAPMREYYSSFISDAQTGFSAHNFRWRNSDNTIRIRVFAKKFNSKYANKFSNYYLFSAEPWLHTLIHIPSTNKVLVAWQISYTPQLHSEELRNRDRAELFIVDTTYSGQQTFLRHLDKFKKIDKIDGFVIYKNMDLKK